MNGNKSAEQKYKSIVFVLITIILMFQHYNLSAQTENLRFNHLLLEEGLSNSTVTSIIQDKEGFIWIGTKNGLNKYDGYKFKVYKHEISNPNSLSDNYITSLAITKDGILLVATKNGGLNIFDPIYESFNIIMNIPVNPNSLSSNNLRVVYAEPDTSNYIFWIGTNGNGLDKFDVGMNLFTHYTHNPADSNSISNNYIRDIVKDSYGYLWVGTNSGLNKLNPEETKWERYFHESDNPNSISNSEAKIIYEDNENNLWVGTQYGVNKIIRSSKIKDKLSPNQENIIFEKIDPVNFDAGIKSGSITSIYEDQQNNIWVGEHYGLHKFNRTSNKSTIYQSQYYNPISISGNLINSIYVDNSGLIWIGTEGSGLNYVNLRTNIFKLISSIPEYSNSLSSPSIRGIYEDDDGILWVGGYLGLNRVDRSKNKFTHFNAENSGLKSDFVYTIRHDNNDSNILWIGTEGNGLFKFNMHSLKVVKIPLITNARFSQTTIRFIFDIYIDKSGILWIASKSGLVRYDKKSKKFSIYQHSEQNPYSISDNKTSVIIEDNNRMLWIGTEANGINIFNRESGKFKHYTHNLKDINSISNNRIKSIYEDKSGTIWVGTNGAGLNKFDRKTEHFEHFTQSDGLPDDIIYGILEDDNQNLWLSTNNGVSRFSPYLKNVSDNKTRFKNYDVSDGLQNIEFNTGSYFKSKDGEMFFGGINGLNSFYPDKITDYSYIPPIVITDFKIYNKSIPIGYSLNGNIILEKSITKTSEIELTYKEDMITFEFAALSFVSADENKFAYKMEGYESQWIFTDATHRFATFTHLDPGNYIFKVKGSNYDNIWNAKIASIKITIAPPWWATWWAYGFYSIMILGSIFGFIHYKIKKYAAEYEYQARIERTKIEERKLVQKETAKDFHDELGNKFTKISLFGELAKRNTHSNPEETIRYLDQVISTSKSLSGGMRDFIWTLDAEQNTLFDVAIRLKDFGETLFNNFGILFKMEELSEQYNEIKLNMNRRRNIILIAKEAMNNILKHANSENVSLEIECTKSILKICISDDGIGFDKKKKTSGYGFRNMKSRATSIGGALNIDSSPNKGTSICLILNLTSRTDID